MAQENEVRQELDLKAKLAGVAKAAEGSAAPAAESTAEFSAESGVKTPRVKTEAEKAEALKKRQQKANMISNLQRAAAGAITSGEKELRKAISEKAYIAAYVCAKGPHIDVTTKKKKGTEDKHDLIVKQSAPSAIKFVAIMVPELLMSLLDKRNFDNEAFDETLSKYKHMTPEETAYRVELVPWAEIGNWMLSRTNNVLREASELFTPYVTKKGTINNIADVTAQANKPAGSCLYIKINPNASKATSAVSVVHNFRSKILTPHNYVALQRYIDVPLKQVYDEQEAKDMIFKYLNKFTNASAGKQPKVEKFSEETRNYITTNEDNKITATALFPTKPGEPWFFSDFSISDWYEKSIDVTGEVKPKALSKPALSQKKITQGKDKNGSVTTRSGWETEKLAEEGATISTYHFDAQTFPQIFAASKKMLTLRAIEEAFAKDKSSRPAKNGTSRLQTSINTEELVGLSGEEIYKIISSNS